VVIRHDGKISPCHMLLDQPGAGTLADDLLDQVKQGQAIAVNMEQKQDCQQCAYRYYCTGGCPLETLRAAHRADTANPHCHIYRALLPAALHLEGLRLMKAHGYLH
jgi:uncharacterized protein